MMSPIDLMICLILPQEKSSCKRNVEELVTGGAKDPKGTTVTGEPHGSAGQEVRVYYR